MPTYIAADCNIGRSQSAMLPTKAIAAMKYSSFEAGDWCSLQSSEYCRIPEALIIARDTLWGEKRDISVSNGVSVSIDIRYLQSGPFG